MEENENINNENVNKNIDEEDSNLVVLKDEEGNDVKFEFLDFIEYNGDNYVILLPTEDVENEESEEVVILKEDKDAENDGSDEESYVSVDDEDTLNKVFDIFKDKFKDEFDFED